MNIKRVLIAEDDRGTRRSLLRALRAQGYDVLEAENGREAWDLITDRPQRVCLVIADWMMPEIDGVELIRLIRGKDLHHYVYAIMLTSKGARSDIKEGFDAGADDYITKPFDPDELAFRVRAGMRVVDLEDELAARNRELERLANLDGLTGVANRRAFDVALDRQLSDAYHGEVSFGIAMIDIDYFKRYNDALGHGAGDECLRRVGAALLDEVRASDNVYRYGGEEFVCLLRSAGLDGARLAAERYRDRIERLALKHPDHPEGKVTVSIGVAAWQPGDPAPPDQVLERADAALYAAKRAGRNRVCSTTEIPKPTSKA